MLKSRRQILLILVLSFLLSACADSKTAPKTADNHIPQIALQDTFFVEQGFYQAIDHSQNIKAENNIRAVIVPHHLLVSSFISDTLKKASSDEIDKVIIIGPNHENVGDEAIATALADWQTPWGTLPSDPDLVNQFRQDLEVSDNIDVFTNEHSIGAQVPFVKYFFPKSKMLAIALSSYAGRQAADDLSAWLSKNIDKSTLVIFSIDFSHYLTKDSADQMDLITKELIIERDINKILKLGNDNTDSPASVATALLLADKLDLKTEILQQGNSFDFLLNKPESTTSYFAISFSSQE